MRYFTYILIATSLLLSQGAFGQRPQREVKVKSSPEIVDIGEVGHRKSGEFFVHNLTDKAIVITKTEASCGCTRVKYSKKPIMPQDSTKISLRYTADKDDVGVFYKTVTIYTTAEQRPLKVSIRGTNKPKR